MAENFAERATGSVRARHAVKIRELAESAQQNAAYILADLDRGRVPHIRNLLDDAQRIAERILALEAVDEVSAIFAADRAEAAPAGPPYPTHPFAGTSSERQSVGLPGHCERCAEVGHVLAHPSKGCGDVGCSKAHGPDEPADISIKH